MVNSVDPYQNVSGAVSFGSCLPRHDVMSVPILWVITVIDSHSGIFMTFMTFIGLHTFFLGTTFLLHFLTGDHMSSILFVHLCIKGCMGCLMNRICNGYLLNFSRQILLEKIHRKVFMRFSAISYVH